MRRGAVFCVLSCLMFSSWVQTFAAPGAGESTVKPALRPPVSPFGNVEEFPPVEARYVRFVILETNGGPPALDELEVFTAGPDPRNVALRDAGAIPWASATEVVGTMHQLHPLNDGRYGNESSWLAGDAVARGVAWQQVVVTSLARPIDRGEITASLSALLGGWGDQEDAMVVQAVFRNDRREPIGEPLAIGPVTARDRGNRTSLLPRASSQKAPAGTRRIEVTMIARRTGGEFNDGYADNVSLVLHGALGEVAPKLSTNLLANGGAEDDGDVTSDNQAPPRGWLRSEGTLTVWPYAVTNFQGHLSPAPAQGRNLFLGGRPMASNLWWAQIELPQVTLINRIVWSRDRTGRETTRTPVRFRIEVATTPDAWRTVASSDDREPYPDLIELPSPPATPSTLSCAVESWDEADGLPSSAVNEIAQTPEGYLWVSTDNGLARFDGDHFTVFNRQNQPELGTSAFGSLYCEPSGRLWIQLKLPPATPNNLAIYENGRFTRVNTRGQLVHWVRTDAEGTPWMACEQGVFPWRSGLLDTNAPVPSLGPNFAVATVMDPGNELWLMGSDRFGKLGSAGWKVVTNPTGEPVSLGSRGPVVAATRRAGGAWIGTGGLAVFGSADYGTNALRPLLPDGRLTEPKPFPWQKRSFQVVSLCEDRSGYLWVAAGTPDYALYRVSPDGTRYERYTAAQGLSDTSFSALFADRDGNLWVGTRRGGINILRPRSFQSVASLPTGQALGAVSLSPARSGGVWLCGNEDGLFRWKDARLFRLFTPQAPFSTILEDGEGGLWTSGWSFGGRRYHGREWIEVLPSLASALGGTVALFEDRAGRVWFGGPHGLACHDHGTATSYQPPLFDRQPPDSVIALGEAADGAIWLGTQSGCLHRLHEGKFQTFWDPEPTQAAPVCSLHFDRAGALWFARFGIGLSRLEAGQLTHYTPAEGLPTSRINGMIEDAKGFVWMTSKVGVYRISQEAFRAFARGDATHAHWRHFTKRDGLPSLECYGEGNQPSLCRTPDGRIWIPTVQGVAMADPETLAVAPPPVVVIEQIQLYGQGNRVRTLLADGAYLQHSGPDPFQVTVPPGRNNLVIHYTGIDFNDPALVTFRYRIPALDREWVDVKGARTATYSGLKPGSYRFELVAMNKSGIASAPASLGLRVLPLWWETRTFQWLVIGLVVAVGPGIYAWRVRWLKRRQRVQEAFSRQLIEREEAERKRIAQEIHDVLGHDLLLLKNSAVQGAQEAATPPQAREQFELISGLASRTLEEARGISHHLRPLELDRLGFRNAIEALLGKVAGTTSLRVFKELDALDDVLPPETQVYLYRLVQEGLNNVLKHARASTVMLEIKRDGDQIRIKLEDDGAGFDLAAVEQRRAGLGLTGMEERVRLVGGQFEISSTPGAGTRIRITVPLLQTPRR